MGMSNTQYYARRYFQLLAILGRKQKTNCENNLHFVVPIIVFTLRSTQREWCQKSALHESEPTEGAPHLITTSQHVWIKHLDEKRLLGHRSIHFEYNLQRHFSGTTNGYVFLGFWFLYAYYVQCIYLESNSKGISSRHVCIHIHAYIHANKGTYMHAHVYVHKHTWSYILYQ